MLILILTKFKDTDFYKYFLPLIVSGIISALITIIAININNKNEHRYEIKHKIYIPLYLIFRKKYHTYYQEEFLIDIDSINTIMDNVIFYKINKKLLKIINNFLDEYDLFQQISSDFIRINMLLEFYYYIIKSELKYSTLNYIKEEEEEFLKESKRNIARFINKYKNSNVSFNNFYNNIFKKMRPEIYKEIDFYKFYNYEKELTSNSYFIKKNELKNKVVKSYDKILKLLKCLVSK